MSKLVESIKKAVELVELKDGMTISFHHHMRNGDFVLNMVMEAIAELGIKDLTVNASSVFDVHEPIIGKTCCIPYPRWSSFRHGKRHFRH